MPNFSLSAETYFAAAKAFSTPFHLYWEEGIRQNARKVKEAFSPVADYREYFAVKALPNPTVLRILKEEGCGVDCASRTELMLADACGFSGDDIMFSANDVSEADFALARKLGAFINLDDAAHARILAGIGPMPETVCLRYNPGGEFRIGNAIMGNPQESKFGMTRAQLSEALGFLKEQGITGFGLHAFLSSNTTDSGYYPTLAGILFQTGRELMEESGLELRFVNLSGGIGVPYRPGEPDADLIRIGEGVGERYNRIFTQNGITGVALKTELGRYMTARNGWLVTTVINKKETYRQYLGVDASACDLMRPAMYGAYHHITIPGKENLPDAGLADVVGSLCENNDKFAVNRPLPPTEVGDLLVIHDTGAHGLSMGYNYNGKLRCGEVLLCADGSFRQIRRPERPADYFSTLDGDEAYKILKAKYLD